MDYLILFFTGTQLLLWLLKDIPSALNALMTLLVIPCHLVTIPLNHKCKYTLEFKVRLWNFMYRVLQIYQEDRICGEEE